MLIEINRLMNCPIPKEMSRIKANDGMTEKKEKTMTQAEGRKVTWFDFFTSAQGWKTEEC